MSNSVFLVRARSIRLWTKDVGLKARSPFEWVILSLVAKPTREGPYVWCQQHVNNAFGPRCQSVYAVVIGLDMAVMAVGLSSLAQIALCLFATVCVCYHAYDLYHPVIRSVAPACLVRMLWYQWKDCGTSVCVMSFVSTRPSRHGDGSSLFPLFHTRIAS